MTGILAVGLIAAAAVPAYAIEDQTGEMKVSFKKAASYELNIPATFLLNEVTDSSKAIGVRSINLPTDKKLQIKVSSGIENGKVTLEDESDATNTCSSTVSLEKGGTGIDANAVVAEFEGMSRTATYGGTLYFTKLENVQAGSYSATIVFTASVVDKNATATETPTP